MYDDYKNFNGADERTFYSLIFVSKTLLGELLKATKKNSFIMQRYTTFNTV